MTAYSEQDMLPISYLRQYLFCPRIPWYKIIESFEPPMPSWVEQGKRWHQQQPELQKKRSIQGLAGTATHTPNAYVESKTLGLYGYADEIVQSPSQLVVIEYKHDKRPPTNAQRIQLMAYLLCAMESHPTKQCWGILYKGGGRKQHRMDITQDDEDKIKYIARTIRKNSESHLLPDSSAQATQCDQCEYLKHCNDR